MNVQHCRVKLAVTCAGEGEGTGRREKESASERGARDTSSCPSGLEPRVPSDHPVIATFVACLAGTIVNKYIEQQTAKEMKENKQKGSTSLQNKMKFVNFSNNWGSKIRLSKIVIPCDISYVNCNVLWPERILVKEVISLGQSACGST